MSDLEEGELSDGEVPLSRSAPAPASNATAHTGTTETKSVDHGAGNADELEEGELSDEPVAPGRGPRAPPPGPPPSDGPRHDRAGHHYRLAPARDSRGREMDHRDHRDYHRDHRDRSHPSLRRPPREYGYERERERERDLGRYVPGDVQHAPRPPSPQHHRPMGQEGPQGPHAHHHHLPPPPLRDHHGDHDGVQPMELDDTGSTPVRGPADEEPGFPHATRKGQSTNSRWGPVSSIDSEHSSHTSHHDSRLAGEGVAPPQVAPQVAPYPAPRPHVPAVTAHAPSAVTAGIPQPLIPMHGGPPPPPPPPYYPPPHYPGAAAGPPITIPPGPHGISRPPFPYAAESSHAPPTRFQPPHPATAPRAPPAPPAPPHPATAPHRAPTAVGTTPTAPLRLQPQLPTSVAAPAYPIAGPPPTVQVARPTHLAPVTAATVPGVIPSPVPGSGSGASTTPMLPLKKRLKAQFMMQGQGSPTVTSVAPGIPIPPTITPASTSTTTTAVPGMTAAVPSPYPGTPAPIPPHLLSTPTSGPSAGAVGGGSISYSPAVPIPLPLPQSTRVSSGADSMMDISRAASSQYKRARSVSSSSSSSSSRERERRRRRKEEKKKKKTQAKEARVRAAREKLAQATQYCFCNKLWPENTFMIACDKCPQWYHGPCVRISEKASQLIHEYVCPSCRAQGKGKIKYKARPCASPWCRKGGPVKSKNSGEGRKGKGKAKPNKGKGNDDSPGNGDGGNVTYKKATARSTSKYCSDDCGIDVALDRLRKDPSLLPDEIRSTQQQTAEQASVQAQSKGKVGEGNPALLASLSNAEDLQHEKELQKERDDLVQAIAAVETKRQKILAAVRYAISLKSDSEDCKKDGPTSTTSDKADTKGQGKAGEEDEDVDVEDDDGSAEAGSDGGDDDDDDDGDDTTTKEVKEPIVCFVCGTEQRDLRAHLPKCQTRTEGSSHTHLRYDPHHVAPGVPAEEVFPVGYCGHYLKRHKAWCGKLAANCPFHSNARTKDLRQARVVCGYPYPLLDPQHLTAPGNVTTLTTTTTTSNNDKESTSGGEGDLCLRPSRQCHVHARWPVTAATGCDLEKVRLGQRLWCVRDDLQAIEGRRQRRLEASGDTAHKRIIE